MSVQPQQSPEIHTGALVVFLSGRRLGQVGQAEPRRFRVETADGAVWLRRDVVFTSDAGEVVLVCERRGLAAYRA